MGKIDNSELRKDIRFLGTVLGQVVRELEGEKAFEMIEEIRTMAWERRVQSGNADHRMANRIAALNLNELKILTRVFTVFLDLLNLVEDRTRIETLANRAREAYPQPQKESIREAIHHLKSSGKGLEDFSALIHSLQIELVFTAHPTEAKRRSVRTKLSNIRNLLRLLKSDLLPEQRDQTEQEIRAEIARIWQTDFVRSTPPTVMQEVSRGLSIKLVLWDVIPKIVEELRKAASEAYGIPLTFNKPCLSFASWIGGDRDGHPGVTTSVTKETILWLRREAFGLHLKSCGALINSLSLSQRQVSLSPSLSSRLRELELKYPELTTLISSWPTDESCRQWLTMVRWRIERAQQLQLASKTSQESSALPIVGAYGSAKDLYDDVKALLDALENSPAGRYSSSVVRDWLIQIDTFGFHLAPLDIRQNAKVYNEVMSSLLKRIGECNDWMSLDNTARTRFLERTLDEKLPLDANLHQMQALERETLAKFHMIHEITSAFSNAVFGAHIISMASAASDSLTVLWLRKQTDTFSNASTAGKGMPIVPLLETISDLQRGPEILNDMLQIPAYRQYVREQDDHQIIMIGYSDSTKDGGYLTAGWALYRVQQQLTKVATKHGIELTFFHGRGGSLGRGGGPTARSILSLPAGTFTGAMRLTEQGEVLAERYDDPAIAHRHLEQVIWSSLVAAGCRTQEPVEAWHNAVEDISATSYKHYRTLIEHPGFIEYFRDATPISEIEQLPIGSRPSRRAPSKELTELRAIPWVFSWTQSRCLLPAWYGVGSAIGPALEDSQQLALLKTMYRDWPFFRALVDNAELALAKSDQHIMSHYAALSCNDHNCVSIYRMITDEFVRSTEVVLALSERNELLDGTPWLKESIRVRNRFIDPLNLTQVELMRRSRNHAPDGSDSEEFRQSLRLTINGIAAGMRTSG